MSDFVALPYSRIAVLYDIPIACNRASADFMLSSPLMLTAYRGSPQVVEF